MRDRYDDGIWELLVGRLPDGGLALSHDDGIADRPLFVPVASLSSLRAALDDEDGEGHQDDGELRVAPVRLGDDMTGWAITGRGGRRVILPDPCRADFVADLDEDERHRRERVRTRSLGSILHRRRA